MIFFKNRWFAITGKFKHFSRYGVIKLIEERGGHVEELISAKTDYLIVGEKISHSKEKQFSKRPWIPKIYEKTFTASIFSTATEEQRSHIEEVLEDERKKIL